MSLDRVNMKPPVSDGHPEWSFDGMIHWDIDTSVERASYGVQGVFCLTDTAEDQGGGPADLAQPSRSREHRPTSGWPGDPREWEQQHLQAAELTALGRKLLGLDVW